MQLLLNPPKKPVNMSYPNYSNSFQSPQLRAHSLLHEANPVLPARLGLEQVPHVARAVLDLVPSLSNGPMLMEATSLKS